MRRVAVSTLSLALVLPALASCGLLEGGGHLDDALDLVPADATSVEFVDRAALAERLDVEDADVDGYVEATAKDAVGGTSLARSISIMAEEAALDERDVEWSVRGVVGEDLFEVYKVDEGVELDDVADALAEIGFAEDDVRDRRHLTGDVGLLDELGFFAGAYPVEFRDLVIDPDEDLLVLGGVAEAVLETLDDDADSLTDADTFDDVLDDTDDVEYALLEQDPRCGDGAGARATPEQLAAMADELGDIGTPESTAYLVSGDDAEPSARLGFGDDDAAEADLGARRTYLEEGRLFATGQPFSEVGSADLEREGPVVRVELSLGNPQVGRRMAMEHDGFLACTP